MNITSLPGINQFSLQHKTAIITGGSKGLGLAMAAGLASAGCKNIILVSRNEKETVAAVDVLKQGWPVNVNAVCGDVTDEMFTRHMVDSTVSQHGQVDILINSAGINIRGAIDELTLEDFNQVMQTNVTGTWLSCKAVTPIMKKQKAGKIINLASTLGLVGLANRTPYTSSKGAIIQMTRALALELAPFHINVNAICPGPFLTEMNLPIADTEDGKKFIVGATALGRWAELKEIQGAAILLASEASNYMVGSMLVVDGGWTAR